METFQTKLKCGMVHKKVFIEPDEARELKKKAKKAKCRS